MKLRRVELQEVEVCDASKADGEMQPVTSPFFLIFYLPKSVQTNCT
jgi:hypothetical protein